MQSSNEGTLPLPSCGPEVAPKQNEVLAKFAGILAAAVLADWLFYGHGLGVSITLFLGALACIAALTNPVKAAWRQTSLAVAVLIAALLPSFVELSVMSTAFGIAGTAYAALMLAKPDVNWFERIGEALILALSGIWRVFGDLSRVGKVLPGAALASHAKPIAVWIVPIALCSVFVMLFWSANPLIDGWLSTIDLRALFENVSFPRMVFWLAAVVAVWPFIFIRLGNIKAKAEQELAALREKNSQQWKSQSAPQGSLDALLTPAVILRSLILFNIRFAMQTTMDVAYLWGGVALPDGMTYAAYAHRGAYPLIVTALLAGAFVIAAMSPGSETERSPLMRALVFLWIGQNILLVTSSILRLDLYVQEYSITYMRLAAFIWMLLVALGLMLIVARIALRRSNGWLVGANLISLAMTLYLCCFVNFPRVIADYNVDHSREISGQGQLLDKEYLLTLGPHVVPSLDRYLKHEAARPLLYSPATVFRGMAYGHGVRMQDWRTWTVRDWELGVYFLATADLQRY